MPPVTAVTAPAATAAQALPIGSPPPGRHAMARLIALAAYLAILAHAAALLR